MQLKDYRADRAHAALLQRQAELRRLLAMKDQTAPYKMSQGFVFLIKGPERFRIEDELRFVEATLALLSEQ